LVLVLRVAYLFEPGGFFLVTCAIFFPQYVPLSAGIHMWTVGAIGIMTLAVMTRASLGHTGQPLSAGGLTQAVYALMPAQLCFVLLLLSPPSVGRFAARRRDKLERSVLAICDRLRAFTFATGAKSH
jgi:uncharacterized protein involved in response to NO